jgi:hypothetical protein
MAIAAPPDARRSESADATASATGSLDQEPGQPARVRAANRLSPFGHQPPCQCPTMEAGEFRGFLACQSNDRRKRPRISFRMGGRPFCLKSFTGRRKASRFRHYKVRCQREKMLRLVSGIDVSKPESESVKPQDVPEWRIWTPPDFGRGLVSSGPSFQTTARPVGSSALLP